jgi:hypothetical protein
MKIKKYYTIKINLFGVLKQQMKLQYRRNIVIILLVILFFYFFILPLAQCTQQVVPQIIVAKAEDVGQKVVEEKVSVIKKQVDEYLDGVNKLNYHQDNLWLGTADLHPAEFTD